MARDGVILSGGGGKSYRLATAQISSVLGFTAVAPDAPCYITAIVRSTAVRRGARTSPSDLPRNYSSPCSRVLLLPATRQGWEEEPSDGGVVVPTGSSPCHPPPLLSSSPRLEAPSTHVEDDGTLAACPSYALSDT
ncbi:hypothetical protein B296_00035379 [Ensete ventricosum]|uniref:Uncharacterized protein n=1 Tax=Ensete ventricosum TaxID=4639 RepID=A0A426Z8K8_ENSVE|nr:hypothetical protein B296_00035379 [Ensete ventricosum]